MADDPNITFDEGAFEKMTPAQIGDMLNRMIAAMEARLARLEKPLMGDGDGQIEIDTDENIGHERTGNKVNLWLEVDKARENIGMGAGAGGDGGSYTFDSQTGMGCLELNHCNYPYAIITTYTLSGGVTRIDAVRIEVANCPFTPCEPTPSTESGGGDLATVHIWRRCVSDNPSASGELPGDLLLSPEVLTLGLSTFDEPVVQLVADGPCYQFIGETTGIITDSDVIILEGCDNEDCSTCDCDETCIRIEDASGNWIQISVDGVDDTFCSYTFSIQDKGGPDGGLDQATFTWVDDAWQVLVTGPSAAWTATYSGPMSGCPTGVLAWLSGDMSAPLALTAGECEPQECPADPPARLRIAGYTSNFFGDIQTYFGSCGGPSYSLDPAHEWDGTFPFHQGECIWWPIEVISTTTPLFYASDVPTAGRAWLLNQNSNFTRIGFIGGVWQLEFRVEGSVTSGSIIYTKATGLQPMGTYTKTSASATLSEPGCYEAMPDTITIEDY